ncbi:MAG: hypothetical protein V1909_02290 [Candidatus Micrarchaeota archaeon]
MLESEAYAELNKVWANTCRVLFGEELGELIEYADWLKKDTYSPPRRKSSISGKDVFYAEKDYCDGAKWISLDEVNFSRKFEPLSINQVKDLDSITGALQERLLYSGNIVLGKSRFVENASNVIDSFYVFESAIISDSKRVAFSDTIRGSENVFGVPGAAYSGYILKGAMYSYNKRCFESHFNFSSSDCYYTTKLRNCRECMFSFGAENKSYAIGNTQLPKDQYMGIKAKLLGEMADVLQKEKKIFSLLDIIAGAEKHGGAEVPADFAQPKEKFDKSVIKRAFSNTSEVVLGINLGEIDDYAGFLEKHLQKSIFLKSPLSGKRVGILSYALQWFGQYDITKRILTEDEIRHVGRLSAGKKTEGMEIDLDKLSSALSGIAYTTFDIVEGNNVNNSECVELINAENCYRGSSYSHSKKCAFCFWPRQSEYMFGSSNAWESAFCINAHYSKKLTRAFEADSCESCADVYFLHNCENVNEGMFCFNAKSLRHAIGNVEIGREKYLPLKEKLLAEIADELEAKKDFRWDIYNVGCPKKCAL